jgi:hypothetical protein
MIFISFVLRAATFKGELSASRFISIFALKSHLYGILQFYVLPGQLFCQKQVYEKNS